MIALSSAVETLRMANMVTGETVYDWSIVSIDGQPTPASNGLQLAPTVPLEKIGPVDILFVCGGMDVQAGATPKVLSSLRRLAERRVPLGALCTGGYALAKAGLLDKYKATIHWENLTALREEFPRISEQFIVDRIRNDRDRQYVPLRAQLGVGHETLLHAARLMEENIEKPLSLDEIAAATELSRRQIERLFKRHLNTVPQRYYLQMRLRRARELLLHTPMPIIDITAACGFRSTTHFSKCYHAQFGYPPSAERHTHRVKPAVANPAS